MAGPIIIEHYKLDDCPRRKACAWAQRATPLNRMPCNLKPFIHKSYTPLIARKVGPKIFGPIRTRFR